MGKHSTRQQQLLAYEYKKEHPEASLSDIVAWMRRKGYKVNEMWVSRNCRKLDYEFGVLQTPEIMETEIARVEASCGMQVIPPGHADADTISLSEALGVGRKLLIKLEEQTQDKRPPADYAKKYETIVKGMVSASQQLETIRARLPTPKTKIQQVDGVEDDPRKEFTMDELEKMAGYEDR